MYTRIVHIIINFLHFIKLKNFSKAMKDGGNECVSSREHSLGLVFFNCLFGLGPFQSFSLFFMTQGLALKIYNPLWWTVFCTCLGYMFVFCHEMPLYCLLLFFFWRCSKCVCMCMLVLYVLLMIVHYELCVLWILYASL